MPEDGEKRSTDRSPTADDRAGDGEGGNEDSDERDDGNAHDGEPADPYDRRVAPYSGETTASVDPVEPPERDVDDVEPDLSEETVDEAERLTRLARRVPDEAEATTYRERRDELLESHDYAAHIRGDDGPDASDDPASGADATLVCHPNEWLDEEGAIDPTRIDEIGRAAEVPLGAAESDAWDAVTRENDAVAEAIRERHGDAHGVNADAFATYVSNHHAKPIAAITGDELAWFRTEYYPRNAWPSDEQRAALDRSLELVYEELDVPMPAETDGEE